MPMTSGERMTCRIAYAAFRRCVSLFAKFCRLKLPTVNSLAAGAGTAIGTMPDDTSGGVSGSSL